MSALLGFCHIVPFIAEHSAADTKALLDTLYLLYDDTAVQRWKGLLAHPDTTIVNSARNMIALNPILREW